MRKFFFRGTTTTTQQQDLVTLGGFTLKARCNANQPELVAVSSLDGWDMAGYRNDAGTRRHRGFFASVSLDGAQAHAAVPRTSMIFRKLRL